MIRIFPNQSFFFNLSSLLVIFFPASLIAGPFVAELFMNISSILITYVIFTEKKYYYFKNKTFYIFIIFCIYLLIRSFFSEKQALSFQVSIFYFRYGLFVITILYLIDHEKKFLKKFFFVLIITFIILIFDGYFQFITGQNIFGFQVNRADRLGGLFFDELILGSFILKLFPLLCISFFYVNNPKFKKPILFLLAMAYFLVLLSGERAAFILINIFLFFSIFGIFKIKNFFLTVTGIFLIVLLLVQNNERLKDRYYDQFIIHLVYDNVANPPSAKRKIIIFPEYSVLFKISQNMFLDNILFGKGLKTFRALCFKKEFRKNIYKVTKKRLFSNYSGCTTHTHNYYLQILSETGLIGFSFVFYFIIVLTKKYYQAIKNKNKINILITSGLIANLWPLTTTGSFFNNWVSMTIFFLVAFYISFYKNENI